MTEISTDEDRKAFVDKVDQMRKDGANAENACTSLGVNYSSYHKWRRNYFPDRPALPRKRPKKLYVRRRDPLPQTLPQRLDLSKLKMLLHWVTEELARLEHEFEGSLEVKK